MKKPSKWAAVDWSLRDCELAKIHGVSRQCVQEYRKKLGKPKGPKKPKKLDLFLAKVRSGDWKPPAAEGKE